MTINDAFKQGIETLKKSGNDNPSNDAGSLLCFILCCDRGYLYSHGEDEIADRMATSYFNLVKERALGKPLQYLTGQQEFMSLQFEVGQGVLVPRQETETLVEILINQYKEKESEISILDLGTGSGCIAVSLAYYLPRAYITASDKMAEVLVMAQRNVLRIGVENRVRLVKSDLFDSIDNTQFDLIVSNPPYIPTAEIDTLKKEVSLYEPRWALDGGDDGLHFYRRIISQAPEFLKRDGVLAFETGFNQADEVAALMSDNFDGIKKYKDLSGIDRIVMGNKGII